MQFMSQATGWEDCVVLAMAPLGILTIVVSAIRVGGPMWLKAIIGRARENIATAEIELMSSTSKDVCELNNGKGIVRCQGSAPVWEYIILLPEKVGQSGDEKAQGDCEFEFMTLAEALECKRLVKKGLCHTQTHVQTPELIITRKNLMITSPASKADHDGIHHATMSLSSKLQRRSIPQTTATWTVFGGSKQTVCPSQESPSSCLEVVMLMLSLTLSRTPKAQPMHPRK